MLRYVGINTTAFFAMMCFYRDWYDLLVAFLLRLIIFRLADFIPGVGFSKQCESLPANSYLANSLQDISSSARCVSYCSKVIYSLLTLATTLMKLTHCPELCCLHAGGGHRCLPHRPLRGQPACPPHPSVASWLQCLIWRRRLEVCQFLLISLWQ